MVSVSLFGVKVSVMFHFMFVHYTLGDGQGRIQFLLIKEFVRFVEN